MRNIASNAVLAIDVLASKSASHRVDEHSGCVRAAGAAAPQYIRYLAGVDDAAAVRTGRRWPDGVLILRLGHSAEAIVILG